MTDLAVIMCVYKNDKIDYLELSVQSILNQTYSNFDFYIAIDGPVSHEIKSYLSELNDDRIKLFKIEKNGGLARALNFLLEIVLKNTEHKYIARMDADDISILKRFEIQYNYLNSSPDISCVGSWYQEIDESGNVISNLQLPVKHDEIKFFFMKRSPMAHSSVMFRRELIEKAGYYPTNTLRLEDYVLWGNALSINLKFANIPEYLLKFRVTKDFYRRRSGIKYGIGYIVAKFKVCKTLKTPVSIYLYSILVGIGRMMPVFIIKSIYLRFRKQTN
jgi:glycosyltransferase involved in cell wall biosynthesis